MAVIDLSQTPAIASNEEKTTRLKLPANFTAILTWTLLVLIICFGSGTRLRGIDRQGISGDEQSSVWFSARGLRDPGIIKFFPTVHWLDGNIVAGDKPFTQEFYAGKMKLHHVLKSIIQSDGGNGLAYSLLLYGWICAFGTNDVLVRMLSLLLGVACIPISYMCARALGATRTTALIAAFLTAVHPQLILFSQLARNYSMAICCSFLSSFFFIVLMNKKSSWKTAIGYFLATTTALLSHYLTVYIFAGQLVIACLFLRDKRSWKLGGIAAISSAAGLGTWLALGGARAYEALQAQNVRLTGLMLQHDPAYTWMKPLNWTNFCEGWWQQMCFIAGLLPYPCPTTILTTFAVGCGVLVCTGLITLLLLSRPLMSAQRYRLVAITISLAIMILIAPTVASILSFRNGHVLAFISRYAIFSVPYFVLFLALAIGAPLKFRKNVYIAAGLTVLSAFVLVQVTVYQLNARLAFDTTFPSSPNMYFTLAKTIQLHYQAGDIVIFPGWLDAATTNAYLPVAPPILQKVDPTLKTKVLLFKSKDSTLHELFDLNGNIFPSII